MVSGERSNVGMGFRAGRDIARLLKLTPEDRPSAILRELETTVQIYRKIADADESAFHAAELRDRIARLGDDACDLLAEIEALKPHLEELAGPLGLHAPGRVLRDELDNLIGMGAASRRQKLKRGRPADRALTFLIHDLADRYFRQTGKTPSTHWQDDVGAFRGDYFRLVNICLDASGIPPHSHEALGQFIKRALRNWTPPTH